MHIVLRSSRARGEWSMLTPRNRKRIEDFAYKAAKKHGVRLYRFANVGNHLHLLVKTRTRTAFQRFLKDVAGTVAILVTGAKKQPASQGQVLGWACLHSARPVGPRLQKPRAVLHQKPV